MAQLKLVGESAGGCAKATWLSKADTLPYMQRVAPSIQFGFPSMFLLHLKFLQHSMAL